MVSGVASYACAHYSHRPCTLASPQCTCGNNASLLPPRALPKPTTHLLNSLVNKEARVSGLHRFGQPSFLVVDVILPKGQ